MRTRRVLTFALCGFANVSSLGVAFGVISTIAPNRSTDLASIGFSALVAGCVANYLTACTIGKYNHDTEILPRNFRHSDCLLTCGITDRYTGQQFRRKTGCEIGLLKAKDLSDEICAQKRCCCQVEQLPRQ
ncbi:hypothetical protein HPB48_023381 [Haemaphysalis longicornis]|uniref:Concentrative nucleoside transporter C-terminal domain-containing protein n=1 Tax=Haemaphysalis longicornis TaxID=44386 RepID=A0A9J6H580_HAELO|nr:hypothetical protein HPB48_023381 [Haemaphysalis longicornis]